jgi:hypothetical protein
MVSFSIFNDSLIIPISCDISLSTRSASSRYCNVLKLNAKKKKLITDWKNLQKIRRKTEAAALLADEQLQLQISKSSSNDTEHILEVLDNAEKIKEQQEEKRLAAKLRIAKWKHDKAKQLEDQKVSLVGLFSSCSTQLSH